MTKDKINLAIHYIDGQIRAANIILGTVALTEGASKEIDSLIRDWEGNREYYEELMTVENAKTE